MSLEDNLRTIPVQLVMFEVKQRPGSTHKTRYGGAIVNCYLKGRTLSQAYADAMTWVEKCGWDVISLEAQHELDRTCFEDSDSGLQYYEQALIDEEVFVFHTYPEGEEFEP